MTCRGVTTKSKTFWRFIFITINCGNAKTRLGYFFGWKRNYRYEIAEGKK